MIKKFIIHLVNKLINSPLMPIFRCESFISIVIPTYEMNGNGVAFLGEALDSIFSQKYSAYEIIISDDSGDDEIKKFIESIDLILKSKIIFVRNTNDKGIARNLNNAINNANGEIIKILFQDDYFICTEALKLINKKFRENPSSSWLVGASLTSQNGSTAKNFLPKINPFLILGVNTISSPSVISFKPSFAGYFDENLSMLVDVEFYVRHLAIFGEPIFLELPTVENRIWYGQAQHSINHKSVFNEQVYIAKKYRSILNLEMIQAAGKNASQDQINSLRDLATEIHHFD